jgi:p-hydroxybenzoate 3-monooxygenase
MAHRTQVGIVGAGPSGLFLAHQLRRAGVACVILEAQSRAYVEGRIRAGVLEHTTAALIDSLGVGARMRQVGLPHQGVILRIDGTDHRIDFAALTGKHITVYSQHDLVRDLIAAWIDIGGEIVFEAAEVAPAGFDGRTPSLRYVKDGAAHELACDFIAGCDGFHGICRASIPPAALTAYEHDYPFAWLGILADSRPAASELIYASHGHGFALASMRGPHTTRLYLQVAPDEDIGAWPEARIWDELAIRLDRAGFALDTGPLLQKGITPMRSFVAEPMRHGRLFLAGDAAHIVPPTGAKGLNLAAADVVVLARALARFYATGEEDGLAGYSDACLARIWQVQRFSWWMTSMLHRFPAHDGFARRMQRAELMSVLTSRAASTALAEVYVGLPLDIAT